MNIKKIILLFLGFFISLEVFLRIYKIDSLSYFRNMKIIHIYNPNYLVGLRPNTQVYIKHFTGKWEGKFTINSLGMRNLEEPDPKRKKIICLGDSLVMGFGVSDEDTFCFLLNQKFKEEYQFLNAGIDGLGSYGAFQRLKEISEKVTPINTVLFFVSPNDFSMPEVLLQRGFLPDDIIEQQRLENPYKKFFDTMQFILTDWFYSFYVIKLTIKQMLLKFSIFKSELKNEFYQFGKISFLDYLKQSFLIPTSLKQCSELEKKVTIYKTLGKSYQKENKNIYTKPSICPEPIPEHILKECTSFPEKIPDLPLFTKSIYEQMIDFAKEKNFRFIVVLLPMQIEEIYCNSIKKYHPLRLYALQSKEFFKKHGIEVWDLMEYTNLLCKTNEYGIKDYFIPEDGHLTKLGNFWVAEILNDKLKEILSQ